MHFQKHIQERGMKTAIHAALKQINRYYGLLFFDGR